MNMFRTLRADEIDCRISQIRKDGSGLILLLYKDARCDQNILDETVGPMNWERKHTRENANCIVSIWDDGKQQWISKEDTGTESNTEKEKGLASDSFKRACFNWGIGRELYTAPFIWIDKKDCNIKKYNDTLKCFDNFTVTGIGYTDGVITGLEIKNQKTGKVCYQFGKVENVAPEKPEQPDNDPQDKEEDETQVQAYFRKSIQLMMKDFGVEDEGRMRKFVSECKKALITGGVIPNVKFEDMTVEQAEQLINAIYENYRPGDAA